MPGKLILLPNVLAEETEDIFLYVPRILEEKVTSLDGLIVENEKEARKYLKRFKFPEGKSFRDIPMRVLNEHTKDKDLYDLVCPVLKGEVWGIVSDAGLPCIADPGAGLVAIAKKKGVHVEPIIGPSSLILALMLSGFSAQKFSFLGYLKRDSKELEENIKELEVEAKKGSTQVCIETPYRSQKLLETLISTLEESTKLSVSSNLTAKDELSMTLSVRDWKKQTEIDLYKKPTVFVISS